MTHPSEEKIQARPFLKWAGGKARVIDQILDYFPTDFNSYYEPFLGGGSLYFSISPQKGRLNDLNPTLISSYIAIRDNYGPLVKDLVHLQKEYYALEHLEAKEKFYYKCRSDFNLPQGNTIRKAALFIFLNKTGFNGMYRENNKGHYNIPFGKHKKPLICDTRNLSEVSRVLKQIKITQGPYKQSIEDAQPGDFIYFDPPYAPLTSTSHFTQYQAGGFNKDDQVQLRNDFMELADKGCFVMMSNSTAPLINDLYSDFYLNKISVARAINSHGMKRGKINEYIITSYKPKVGEYVKRRRSLEDSHPKQI